MEVQTPEVRGTIETVIEEEFEFQIETTIEEMVGMLGGVVCDQNHDPALEIELERETAIE